MSSSSGLDIDPNYLKNLIGTLVEIPGSIPDQSSKIGRLIAVDPVSSSVILLLNTDESGGGAGENNQQQDKIVLVPWIDLTKISEKKAEKEETAINNADKKVEIQKQQQQRYQKIREQLLLPKGRLSQAAVSGSGDNNDDRVDLKRKAQVIDLLQRHQIQVTQEDDDNSNNQHSTTLFIQGGLARLRPPYRQFEASNVIVLDRLNTLLDQMPGQ